MRRPRVADEILTAAHDRSKAREARDWAEADRLRAVIEDAGWRVVDRGVDFRLEPAMPPDLDADGATIHGSSASVPSRLDEPSDREATIVLLADGSTDLDRRIAALRGGTARPQVVVVAAEPWSDHPANDLEVVLMTSTATPGARLNAGIRRATGAILILLDGTASVEGDIVTPLVQALDHAAVAVVGAWGSRTDDLRTFTPAEDDADVIDLGCLALRRADALRIGPLDERFQDRSLLGAWLSLALRFGSATPAFDDLQMPLAGRVVGLPGGRRTVDPSRGEDSRASGSTGSGAAADEARRKAARRDFYRLLDAFGPFVANKREIRA